MNELKASIVKEATTTLAGNYNTTSERLLIEIANGNVKVLNELNDICEKTLEALYA